MKFSFTVKDNTYTFDSALPLNISVQLKDGADNPNCYYADPVKLETIRQGNFVGSVAEGGPVNHKKIHVTPHGNGTHTECYGHISTDPEATISHCLQEYLYIAQLISVYPRKVNDDLVITLADVVESLHANSPEALIIRTLPNDFSKTTHQYSGTNPPYLEPQLCAYLCRIGVKHLLVDLPSIDKEVDEGLLLAHKAFWQYPTPIRKDCTITELVYIPNTMVDDIYLLNLQILNIDLDVSPSQPILYRITNKG